MNITVQKKDGIYEIAVDGRLDTATAPSLEEKIKDIPADTKEVVFDFSNLEYISSAGLRTLLLVSNTLNEDSVITVKGANDMVLDIFDVTGFSDMLNIV